MGFNIMQTELGLTLKRFVRVLDHKKIWLRVFKKKQLNTFILDMIKQDQLFGQRYR